MPAWIVNILLLLLERYLPKLVQGAANKWDQQRKNAEVKNDLKKATKIKDRQHRADNILNALKR